MEFFMCTPEDVKIVTSLLIHDTDLEVMPDSLSTYFK